MSRWHPRIRDPTGQAQGHHAPARQIRGDFRVGHPIFPSKKWVVKTMKTPPEPQEMDFFGLRFAAFLRNLLTSW